MRTQTAADVCPQATSPVPPATAAAGSPAAWIAALNALELELRPLLEARAALERASRAQAR
jgi:hypothetical protein